MGERPRKESKLKKGTQPRATRSVPTLEETYSAPMKPFSFTGWGYEQPELGVAERRAVEHDEGAADFEKGEREALAGNNPEGAARLAERAKHEREKAEWWRKLGDYPAEKAGQHYEDCERDAGQLIDTLLARGEADEAVALRFSLSLWRLHGGLHALAARGRKWAAYLLVNSLHEAVAGFEMLATTKPELFDFLRNGFGVPAIISPSKEKTADNQRFVKQLHAGGDYHFAIMPTGRGGKKWKYQEGANGLAARLHSHIEEARCVYELDKSRVEHAGKELPALRHEARWLELFSTMPGVWQSWAEVAWRVLAEISPDNRPGLHAAFCVPKSKICNVRKTRLDPYFGKVTDAPSIAEQDIKEALFGAFELMETGKTRRTAQRQKASPTKRAKAGK